SAHPGAGRRPAGGAHALPHPGAGRRLEKSRLARHDRKCHSVRPPGCRDRRAKLEDDPMTLNQVALGSRLRGNERSDRTEPKAMNEINTTALEDRIEAATRALLDRQKPDGHWVFELEADGTIPSEYILMRHYLAEPVDAELERKIAIYLRRIQGAHGGWPLFHEGAFDMSASVKAYYALKLIGDPIDADHMRRAREAIRSRGGAARANVFTRT